MYKSIKETIHFVGIGGVGMSGIAEVLVRLGFPVSGSDASDSPTLRHLERLGVKAFVGHDAKNLGDAKVVVTSSAITSQNSEVLEARKRHIPIVPRAEMLAELMRLKYGIAVAGTHGKTTTTSLVAAILSTAALDPTVIVGGKVTQWGSNAKLGQGQFLVAEADESDGSFLKLSPVITIITNIDNDHLDFYKDLEHLRLAFLEFANKVPYYGRSILCVDDKEVAILLPQIKRPTLTYGFSHSAQLQILKFEPTENGSRFSILREGQTLCTLELSIPGRHNALNAVAALAVALEMDVPLDTIQEALKHFKGVSRRFEFKGEMKSPRVTIVDDYGHHPTEIAATLTAARAYWSQKNPQGRVVVAFQPHRFSRTEICWNQFAPALAQAHEIFLMDVYPAGEKPLPQVNSQILTDRIRSQGITSITYSGSLENTAACLKQKLQDGDLLMTLGAGSVTQLGPLLLQS